MKRYRMLAPIFLIVGAFVTSYPAQGQELGQSCKVIVSCGAVLPDGTVFLLAGNASRGIIMTFSEAPGSAGPQFTATFKATSCSPYPGNAVVMFDTSGNGFELPNPLPLEFISTSIGLIGTLQIGESTVPFTCYNR